MFTKSYIVKKYLFTLRKKKGEKLKIFFIIEVYYLECKYVWNNLVEANREYSSDSNDLQCKVCIQQVKVPEPFVPLI